MGSRDEIRPRLRVLERQVLTTGESAARGRVVRELLALAAIALGLGLAVAIAGGRW